MKKIILIIGFLTPGLVLGAWEVRLPAKFTIINVEPAAKLEIQNRPNKNISWVKVTVRRMQHIEIALDGEKVKNALRTSREDLNFYEVILPASEANNIKRIKEALKIKIAHPDPTPVSFEDK